METANDILRWSFRSYLRSMRSTSVSNSCVSVSEKSHFCQDLGFARDLRCEKKIYIADGEITGRTRLKPKDAPSGGRASLVRLESSPKPWILIPCKTLKDSRSPAAGCVGSRGGSAGLPGSRAAARSSAWPSLVSRTTTRALSSRTSLTSALTVS